MSTQITQTRKVEESETGPVDSKGGSGSSSVTGQSSIERCSKAVIGARTSHASPSLDFTVHIFPDQR
ncbi:hypothetical protein ACJ72_01944 [Emergomyces africanus]|uniref:Uncharacterized protein n=1 Tax=Emergomyces africanus TaxID=1955775 RepID=A0A1B7P4B4_9EURO|nr:hypothetical protein ACJ72_01944 [Emergomyces africanus]